MENNYQLITKTVAGLEDVLAAEIRNLGAKNVKVMHRAVICEGNKEMMYRLNYNVRTGLKVLKPFKTFFAKNPDELYKKVQEINQKKQTIPCTNQSRLFLILFLRFGKIIIARLD